MIFVAKLSAAISSTARPVVLMLATSVVIKPTERNAKIANANNVYTNVNPNLLYRFIRLFLLYSISLLANFI